MKLRKKGSGPGKVDIQMTPMIDIVFQLLVFFVMTFKIVEIEGDFNIKMPLAAPSSGATTEPFPPIKVRLTANADGTLAGLYMGEAQLGSFDLLHFAILDIVGTDRGPGSFAENAEVEIDADYNLRYEYVINTVTAISGRMSKDGQIMKLIEKVKFAPPRPAS